MANDIYQFKKMKQITPQIKEKTYPSIITFGMGITFGEGYCFGQLIQASLKILPDFRYEQSKLSISVQGIEGSFRY